MTAAERIRKYVLDHPQAKTSEIAEAVDAGENTVKATISKDVRAGRCVRLEDGSIDYSSFFNLVEKREETREWCDDIRRELVEYLMRSIRGETDSEQIRTLSKEVDRILKEISR